MAILQSMDYNKILQAVDGNSFYFPDGNVKETINKKKAAFFKALREALDSGKWDSPRPTDADIESIEATEELTDEQLAQMVPWATKLLAIKESEYFIPVSAEPNPGATKTTFKPRKVVFDSATRGFI